MGARKPGIDPAVYNVPEIAALMSINLVSAYELAKQEDFPAIRIGKRILVPKEAFHKWLDQRSLERGEANGARNRLDEHPAAIGR